MANEPYEGYSEDLQTIKSYFNYLKLVFTRNPEVVKEFASSIREWKEKDNG